MNSKSEILGTRIPRKKVEIQGQEIEIIVGDPEKLTGPERKLVKELEEGGEEHIDKDFWDRITSSQKRKVTDLDPGLDHVPPGERGDDHQGSQQHKKQRLITSYS